MGNSPDGEKQAGDCRLFSTTGRVMDAFYVGR
jgi:hypothetical protein